jgi:hypothetical protein
VDLTLNFEAAVEEPYHWVVGVVLLRSAAAAVQLRIPEAEEEGHLGRPVAGAHQHLHCKARGHRLCFCAVVQVRVVVAAVLPDRQPTAQEPIQLQRMSGRSAGRWPLRLKTAR